MVDSYKVLEKLWMIENDLVSIRYELAGAKNIGHPDLVAFGSKIKDINKQCEEITNTLNSFHVENEIKNAQSI